MRSWSHEKTWAPRAVLLVLMGWWSLQHMLDVEYQPIIGGLNFGIHELGHVIFAPLGMFLGIAGGTILQCAAPLAGAAQFVRQRDYFAIAFCVSWLATNFFSVAVYLADASSQSLDLLGLGSGEPIHDWNWLLSRTGLLGSEATLAFLLRAGGFGLYAASLAFGGWLVFEMFRGARSRGEWI